MRNVFEKFTDKDTFSRILDYKSVSEMWEKCLAQYSNAPAVATDTTQLTYAELEREVSYFRSVLLDNGIQRGVNVGIYMPNSIDFVKVYLAITTLGAVAVLLPAQLDEQGVLGSSLKYDLSMLVYSPALENNLTLLRENNPNTKLLTSSEASENRTELVDVEGTEPCTIIFTGGTTGKSKGALLSNRAVMRGTKNGCYGIREIFGQRYMLVLPLTHVFGLIRNMLTALYTGSCMFICSHNKNMFRNIATFQPTIIILVPALAEMALQLSKNFKRNMLGDNMKTIICGAANVPPYLVEEYGRMNITLLPGYGLTESANLVSGNPVADKKPDSVGYIYPDIETKIVDGELWLKGPNMQDCYYKEVEENKIAYTDGWFKTGDLVRLDEDGCLYIVGRAKEILVLSTGENISPAELEAKFLTIEEIQDCLVYIGDSGKLELEVYLRKSVVTEKKIDSPQELVKAKVFEINETLMSTHKISKVVFRDTDFIRSPSMKIIRSKNGNAKN